MSKYQESPNVQFVESQNVTDNNFGVEGEGMMLNFVFPIVNLIADKFTYL